MQPVEDFHNILLSALDNDFRDHDEIAGALRTFRNSCATNPEYQTEAGKLSSLIPDILTLIKRSSLCQQDETPTLLLLGIQALGNLIVNNPSTQQQLWCHADELLPLLELHHEKARNYTAMLLHNLVLGDVARGAWIVKEKKYNGVLLAAMDGIEFALFTVEALFKQGNFPEVYDTIDINSREFILEVLLHNVGSNKWLIGVEDLKYLSGVFKKNSDKVLKIDPSYLEGISAKELHLILQVLGKATTKDDFKAVLQTDKSLFINCLFLLKGIHQLSKEPDNIFTRVESAPQLSDAEGNPWFGFKAELVRVLGNLCFRCRDLQDIVRDTDSIALFLDCCNIDAKNPYLMQWAILAVRNLCEGNLENQTFIREAKAQGQVPSNVRNDFCFL